VHHAVNSVRLRRFEVQRPSLQEIFVRLVAEDAGEAEAELAREEVMHE
jgi:ABC-type uncharacterized transport system ATPase subunit